MRCDELQEKIIQYMEGSLSNEEKRAFEEHLQKCESCRVELQHAMEIDSLLKQETPRYWEEIKVPPGLAYRLESSGPWTEPKISFNLKEWLFAPWQSRRIVTAALSTALVAALIVLIPLALMPGSPPPPALNEMASPAPTSEGAEGIVSSIDKGGQRLGIEEDAMTTPPPMATPMPSVAPTTAPTAAPAPAAATPTSIADAMFTSYGFSGRGSQNSPPIKISSSPWQLKWSATASVPDSFVVRIVDAQTEEELGRVAVSFTSPGRMDNESLFYDKMGNFYLSIETADSTSWTVEAREVS
ncbi:MAG: zf-HC2 domain-containing protein [Dehalococcoidia bacterium]|nr:zf-HC2 domain-containing protein [Dehalococcoidia bacterium]